MESAHSASSHIIAFFNGNDIPNTINTNLVFDIKIYRLDKQFKHGFAFMMPHSLTASISPLNECLSALEKDEL